MNHQKSEALFAKACRYIPGGVNSPVRAFANVKEIPLFVDHADGAYLYDVDGNAYLDFICSWGPMILGHNHPLSVQCFPGRSKERGHPFSNLKADGLFC